MNSSINDRKVQLVNPLGYDINATTTPVHWQRKDFFLNTTQTILLLFLFGFGFLMLSVTVNVKLLNTVIIFFSVVGMGLWFCHRTRVDLGDAKLNILSTLWLVKVIITFFLLYAGWIPQLDPSSDNWGYDPQRFFIDAWDLIENGWSPLAGSAYQGIVFYYGAIFYLFGHNPVIPALINVFITLLSTLFLIRCVYSFLPGRTAKDWTIASLLLVPEVLWYDVMTSRETLMAAMIIFAILSVGRYLFGVKSISLANTIFLASTALFVILAVRTSMVFPVVASIGVMIMLLRSKHKMAPLTKLLLFSLAIAGMTTGPFIQNLLGGGEIDYLSTWENLQSSGSSFIGNQAWSENSIGFLLYPRNIWQSLLFLPPRMVLYLAAPLPNVAVSMTELIDGSWNAWQDLMTILTSFLMLLGLPFALAGTAQAWRLRRYLPGPLALHVTFWITFMAVAGGNIIIHERYRVMCTLLLFACMWFGYTRCSRREVKQWATRWFILLATGAIFSIGYKLLG